MNAKMSDVVVEVLKNDPAARVNDNRLVVQVCRRMGCELTDEQVEILCQLPNFAGIVRSRARIQAEGRFRPDAEVWKERRNHRRKQ